MFDERQSIIESFKSKSLVNHNQLCCLIESVADDIVSSCAEAMEVPCQLDV